MRSRTTEIIAGLVVIAAAAAFLIFAFTRSGATTVSGYTLSAQFGGVGALEVGSPVKIAGVTVGHVSTITLNPASYAAVVKFSVDPTVQVPKDSSAAIESASLLGSDYLSLSPGGSNTMLKPGQAITVTQSAINIESLLGKFVFSAANLAGSAGKSGSAPAKPANSLPSGLKP
jgi:phospholipid/cholesterol/gamma-HCH transport system substrate-binding protein